MDICCGCSGSLHESLSAEDEGQQFKSCPKCSVEAGYHVFYKQEDFGFRDMGDGRHIVQSWCPSCRSNLSPALPPAFICK